MKTNLPGCDQQTLAEAERVAHHVPVALDSHDLGLDLADGLGGLGRLDGAEGRQRAEVALVEQEHGGNGEGPADSGQRAGQQRQQLPHLSLVGNQKIIFALLIAVYNPIPPESSRFTDCLQLPLFL